MNYEMCFEGTDCEASEQAVRLCAVTWLKINGYLPGVERLCRMTGIASRPFVLRCLTRIRDNKDTGTCSTSVRRLSEAV